MQSPDPQVSERHARISFESDVRMAIDRLRFKWDPEVFREAFSSERALHFPLQTETAKYQKNVTYAEFQNWKKLAQEASEKESA